MTPRRTASKRRKATAPRAGLGAQNAALRAQLAAARDQQAATAEILRVISRAPTEIGSVLEAIAASATRICQGYDAIVQLRDGDVMRRAAHFGPVKMASAEVLPIDRTRIAGAAIVDRAVINGPMPWPTTRSPKLVSWRERRGSGPRWQSRSSDGGMRSAPWSCGGTRSGRSPMARSRSCRPSPTRR